MNIYPFDQKKPETRVNQSGICAPVYVSLGSNQALDGTAPVNLLRLGCELLERGGAPVTAVSTVWASPAWPPGCGLPDYVNAVARIEWPGGNLDQLMSLLHTIEQRLGRVRDPDARYGARTLDLDLIAAGTAQIHSPPRLILPHASTDVRDFVLGPLLELEPDWSHPVTGVRGTMLLEAAQASARAAGVRPAHSSGPFPVPAA